MMRVYLPVPCRQKLHGAAEIGGPKIEQIPAKSSNCRYLHHGFPSVRLYLSINFIYSVPFVHIPLMTCCHGLVGTPLTGVLSI